MKCAKLSKTLESNCIWMAEPVRKLVKTRCNQRASRRFSNGGEMQQLKQFRSAPAKLKLTSSGAIFCISVICSTKIKTKQKNDEKKMKKLKPNNFKPTTAQDKCKTSPKMQVELIHQPMIKRKIAISIT